MDPVRRYTLSNVAVFVVGLGHALLTWPLGDVAALFGVGATVVFVLEALGIAAGLHRHQMTPQVLGVPLVVVGAWPAIVYVTYRFALLAQPAGVQAAAGAALLATLIDAFTEVDALAVGVWSYPEHPLSRLRFAGVPWWNVAAWLAIVFVTAMAPTWL